MNPVEKFDHPFPETVRAEIQAVVDEYKAEYDERDYDYFEYMEGFGNELTKLKRGTEAWEEAMYDVGDEFCPVPYRGHKWYDHLTGNRSALHAYPGWYLETFEDAIRDAVHEILYAYALEGTDPEDDWSDALGEMFCSTDVLDIVVGDALSGRVSA